MGGTSTLRIIRDGGIDTCPRRYPAPVPRLIMRARFASGAGHSIRMPAWGTVSGVTLDRVSPLELAPALERRQPGPPYTLHADFSDSWEQHTTRREM